jgi:aminopeptidase 2
MSINEYDRVLDPLTRHAGGKQALWEWLKVNADAMQKKIGGGSGRFAMLVEQCTNTLSTKEQYEDVRSFFEGRDTEVCYVLGLWRKANVL